MTTSQLTFDDEFNSLSLWNGTSGTWDTAAPYVPLNGNGYSLPSNGEQEWYINSNYAPTASVKPWTVSNGILTLTGAPAPASIQPLINGYQYTSGVINTSQSFSQTYGYFEMRAELPAGQGTWPAFWLIPENGSWPPEIDAMEMLGNNPSVYYTSVHSGTASNEVSAGQPNDVPDTSAGFHTYGVDWEPNTITYYFDGKEVYQTPTPADMNVPMYMIANLALGGGWPGNVDSTTPLPAQMQIDWIRAYSSLPSWIADGSDPTDVNHTPAGSVGSGSGSSSGGGGSGGSSSITDSLATYTAPSGITTVTLTGSAAQTVTANNAGDTIISNDYGSTLIGGTGNDTLVAGHGHDMLTGGGGSDTFVFKYEPWNAGHITDFNVATDKLDLSGIFSSIGYTGTNPVADGYLSFQSDGAGDTQVFVDPQGHSTTVPILVTTLDHVSPSTITAADYGFSASSTGSTGSGSTGTGSTGTGSTGTGSTGTGSTGTGSTGSGSTGGGIPIATTAANYTVPAGDDNVVMTGSAAQTVTANNAGDTITANDYASTIIGGTGNDTLIAGHGHDTLTGGGGSDTFAFKYEPWNAGHVTDFNVATDKLDLSGILSSIGYTGTNPVADGYLSFQSDGAGDTQVYVDPQGHSTTMPILVTTLDHVSPSTITAADYGFSASGSGSTGGGSTGGGTTGGGTTGTGGTTVNSTPIDTTAASYTVPAGDDNVVMTGATAQTVTANNLGDTITANDYASTIIGGTGNDTLIAGHGADHLTGGGGNDTFVFKYEPWNAGHVTDFNVTTDKLDLSGIFHTLGYSGTNPVADGYLSFQSDGAGDTQVYVDPQGHSTTIPILVTTLDHVAPSTITAADYGFGSSAGSTGTGSTGTGSTGTGSGSTGGGTTGGGTTVNSTPIHTTAASYTVPAGDDNVVMTGATAQTVTANNLGDTITANDYASTIIGGTGNDTLIAGHGADHLTGGAGNDTFVFNALPWNAGHITDFNTATDTINLSGIFSSIGYTGANPVADGYLSLQSDGAGDTKIYVDPHGHSTTVPILVTTLDHVSPSSLTSHDWIFHTA